jgi:hypothetical protein
MEEPTGPTEEATGPTGPTEEATGPTGPTEETNLSMIAGTIYPPPPDIISLDDLLSDIQVMTKKEDDDRILLESIGNLTTFGLRPKLVEWALNNFSSLFEIHSITIHVPTICVDGATRDLRQYIVYLTGKTLDEYIEVLTPKFVGMNVAYGYFGNKISIFLAKV